MGINRPIETIPNAVDTADLSDAADRVELERRYPRLRNKRIILSLGRLCPIKGLKHLLDAFALVIRRFDDTILVIAGPDENSYQKQLRSHARALGLNGEVLFTGRVEGPPKVGLLRSAKVLAMPSDSESFGLSAAEAAACATPVVLTADCGIAPFLTKANAALTVSQQPDRIAQALNTLLADENLRLAMGQNARRLIETEFSWKKAAQRTDALLSDLISQ